MALTVRISPLLRKFIAGQETVQAEGGTIGDLLNTAIAGGWA